MKRIGIAFLIGLIVCGAAFIFLTRSRMVLEQKIVQLEKPVETSVQEQSVKKIEPDQPFGDFPGKIKLSSPQMKAGEKISLAYTCYQKNVSPPLNWSNWPAETKSFVVFFEKAGGDRRGSVYWTLYNIPVSISAVAEALPKTATLGQGAMQGMNDNGNVGYYGPCLPKGEHRFVFTVFALDAILPLPGGVDKATLIQAIDGHILDKGILLVTHYYRL